MIIVAAGQGTRLGGALPKQYREIAGRAVLAHTLDAVLAAPVGRVLVAIDPAARGLYDAAVAGIGDARLLPPVDGGVSRAETVRNALEALAGCPPEIVLIHDAARPFAPPELFARVAEAAAAEGGAIAAEPVVDALWQAEEGRAMAPRPRAGLWRAQTPQGFRFAAILAAHRGEAARAGPPALDDAEVARRAGLAVRLVEGVAENFKITGPGDLARAARMLERDMPPHETRTGHGFDVHRFCAGDHVWLCGVRLAHERGLLGHSDADVGLHALSDALYGALAEGDIGTHFPPSDPRWKGAASHVFLSHAGARVAARGGRIVNLDVTLLCERPRIGPHAAAMRGRIAQILSLDPGRVGVKATTMERMGLVGREEGMGAMATATVVLEAPPPSPTLPHEGGGGANGEGGA